MADALLKGMLGISIAPGDQITTASKKVTDADKAEGGKTANKGKKKQKQQPQQQKGGKTKTPSRGKARGGSKGRQEQRRSSGGQGAAEDDDDAGGHVLAGVVPGTLDDREGPGRANRAVIADLAAPLRIEEGVGEDRERPVVLLTRSEDLGFELGDDITTCMYIVAVNTRHAFDIVSAADPVDCRVIVVTGQANGIFFSGWFAFGKTDWRW